MWSLGERQYTLISKEEISRKEAAAFKGKTDEIRVKNEGVPVSAQNKWYQQESG